MSSARRAGSSSKLERSLSASMRSVAGCIDEQLHFLDTRVIGFVLMLPAAPFEKLYVAYTKPGANIFGELKS